MDGRLLPVFVKNLGLVEEEFFARELNLRFVNKQIALESGVTLVACTEPQEWDIFFKAQKPETVVFFLLGNETYDVGKYLYFNNIPAIKHVYIYNPPRKNRLFALGPIMGFLYDCPKAALTKIFYRTLKNSFDFAKRSRNIKLNYPWTEIPLGYTNRFIQELTASNLIHPKEKSAFKVERQDIDLAKKYIGFIGQSGSWVRKNVLSAVEKSNKLAFNLDSQWGGSIYRELGDYARDIIDSKVNLVPPGNLTNQTFRYLECLILWRLPVTPPITIQDHHFNRYWTEFDGPRFLCYSYLRLAKFVTRMKSPKYMELVTRYRLEQQQLLTKIRTQIFKSAYN